MAVQILRPQKRDSSLSKLGSIVGTGMGINRLLNSDPMGAFQVAGGVDALRIQPQEYEPEKVQDDAMTRRSQALAEDTDATIKALSEGEAALNSMPSEVRQKFTRPFFDTVMAIYSQLNGGIQQ